MRTLFVTWDGPQLSYVESLFLPIFEALTAQGYPFDILQFRWGDAAQERRIRARCAASGIGYVARPVHRGLGGLAPFATAFAGGRVVRAATRRFGSDAIMPRSHMPALATLCARSPLPIIFDADGLPADERVEFAGLSPTGIVYRALRDIEAQIVRRAHAVITRAPAAADILMARAGPPIDRAKLHVVVNGRDPALFDVGDEEERCRLRRQLGIPATAPMLVYSGSIGAQYRIDRIAALLAAMQRHRPDTRLLLLTGSPELAQAALQDLGVDGAAVTVMRARPEEVPAYLAAGDVGLAYRMPGFSMQAVAPVKLAEYLLCGLPVVGTANIGDTVAAQDVGVFHDDRDDSDRAARWILDVVMPGRDAMRRVARRTGLEHFALARSVSDYLRALTSVTPSPGQSR